MSRQENENMNKVGSTSNEPVTMRRGVTTETYRAEGPLTWEEMRVLLRGEGMGVHERTWRPTTAGVLEIIAGTWNFIIGAAAVGGTTVFSDLFGDIGTFGGGSVAGIGLGAFMLVLGIISIIGGIMAVRRTAWGMALAGAITASIPTPLILPFIMGTLSIIFVTLGRREFKGHEMYR